MAKPEIVNDIRPRGDDSAYMFAPFDEGLKALEDAGYGLISLEENARLRIQEGPGAFVSGNGNWVREGVLYVPDGRVLLTKNNPILKNAKEATEAHRKGELFYVTDEQRDEALEDSVNLRGGPIPTNRFAKDERTVFMFGEVAKDYGNFLRENGVRKMPIYLESNEGKSFVNPAWFSSLGNRSFLYGDNRDLNVDNLTRGVLRSAAGARGLRKFY